MFRFYELYSLYLKNMASCENSPTWCLCEKLPRSILHITPNPELWCDVCGKRRRPRACVSSSSDEEEEKITKRRQEMLAEQQRAAEAHQGTVRVKVAMSAAKPMTRRRSKCYKCGGDPKPNVGCHVACQLLQAKNSKKIYVGRFGHYRRPQRLQAKRKDDNATVKMKPQEGGIGPPPTSPTYLGPAGAAKAIDLKWEPREDMPNLVAFAHEVFNRPLHLRKRESNFYDNLFVSDFIPLEKPITNAAGGAVSKRRRIFGGPLRSYRSRPLQPLSHVLAEILAKQKVRAKGGGLLPNDNLDSDNNNAASQFTPFDIYDGPSEDALVVEGARLVLRQPNALHIKQRTDLPDTRLSSFESEPSSDCSSSSPYDLASAPPAERQRHSYGVGAPLRLHEMMKTVAHSGLSDSSASSSSTSSSSSHKSVSSTQPIHHQSVRSCGGKELVYAAEKPAEGNPLHVSIMEKILWLIDQKAPAGGAIPTNPLVDEAIEHIIHLDEHDAEIENSHTESVKGLLHFMESINIADGGDSDNPHNRMLISDDEDELKSHLVDTSVPEIHHSNDMSNELPVNSTNKSAGDAKYIKVFSNAAHRSKLGRKGCFLHGKGGGTTSGHARTSSSTSSTSMWSMFSGLFTPKQSNGNRSTVAPKVNDEMKPLRSTENLHYGSVNTHQTNATCPLQTKKALPGCIGKKLLDQKSAIPSAKNPSCQKCGFNRVKNCGMPKSKTQESLASTVQPSNASQYQTARSAEIIPKHKYELKTRVSEHSNVQKKKNLIITKDIQHQITDKSLDNLRLKSIKEKCKYATNSQSATSFQSCFGTESLKVPAAKDQKYEPKLRNLQLQKQFPKQPILYSTVKSFEIVRCEPSVIIVPKMVAYTFDKIELGQLKTSFVYPINVKDPLSLYPDIPNVATNQIPKHSHNETTKHRYNGTYHAKNLKVVLASIAHSESYQHSDNTSVDMENKKGHNLPVWPPPIKHKRHHIKYQAMQLEYRYSVTNEINYNKNQLHEEFNEKYLKKLSKKRKMKKNEPWVIKKSVERKIDEMMTKPIKLLDINRATALQTQ